MLKIKGIDISRAQEQFDFTAAVSAGVKFVIIRAGIRTDEDTYFRRNIEQCRKLGIDFGCYWYVTATDTAELDRQINACVKTIGDEKPSYPVFCDMEEQRQIDNLTSKERTDMALEFCDRLNKAGLPSGVYANPSWLESYYQKERIVGKRDIWLAHWTESPDKPSRYDYGQKMWQWGIDSIAGKDVDGDICFINYPAKTDYWYKTHSGTDTPAKPSDPVKPTTPTAKTYKAGEAVQLSNTALYGSSTTSQPANHLTGTYYIHIADDVLNGRIRITTPKGCSAVTGWVNVSDIGRKTADQPAPSADVKTVKVGGKVKVNAGATFSDGTEPYPFVYTTIFDVITMSKDGKEALIGIGTDVTGWMYVKDLKAE